MSTGLYEILSLGMRYWFTLLGVLIVLRTFLWLWKDRRQKHRRLRSLPDAGLVGELQVIEGTDNLPADTAIPLPYEGTLGFLRSCDVIIPCEGVGRQHLDFSFQPGLGLLIYPRRGQTCLVDGEEMTSRSKARLMPLHHGGILQIGDVKLRVRLFAGLDAGGHSHFQQDEIAVAELPNDRFASTADIPIPQNGTGWQPVPPQQQPYPWRYRPPVPQPQPFGQTGTQDAYSGHPLQDACGTPQQSRAPQNPSAAQQYPPQNPYAAQQYPPQDPYAAQRQYPPQDPYAAQQQYPPQDPYAAQQQYPPQNSYAAQQYPPQNSYAAQQQYSPQDPYAAQQQYSPHPLQDAYGTPQQSAAQPPEDGNVTEPPLHPRRAERRRRSDGEA